MSGRPRLVFLIDSDESTRVTHETILRAEGYDIMSAFHGSAALSQIRDQPPDLLLIGRKIGRMPAVQLIQLLRQDPSTSGVRICMYAAESARDAAIKAGADCFLVAPVRTRDLIREVVALIGRA